MREFDRRHGGILLHGQVHHRTPAGVRQSREDAHRPPPRPNPFGDRVSVASFHFEDPRKLAEHLRGATTLYNTYWVRFPRGDVTFERAVANSQTLIGAAGDAGVRRIVHVSITNPSKDSPFEYFRGKARVER